MRLVFLLLWWSAQQIRDHDHTGWYCCYNEQICINTISFLSREVNATKDSISFPVLRLKVTSRLWQFVSVVCDVVTIGKYKTKTVQFDQLYIFTLFLVWQARLKNDYLHIWIHYWWKVGHSLISYARVFFTSLFRFLSPALESYTKY